MFHNFYPLYAQYAQNSQAHGFGVQYPQMVQYPYLPQQYSSTGILSLPSSVPTAATTAGEYFTQPLSTFIEYFSIVFNQLISWCLTPIAKEL